MYIELFQRLEGEGCYFGQFDACQNKWHVELFGVLIVRLHQLTNSSLLYFANLLIMTCTSFAYSVAILVVFSRVLLCTGIVH